MGDNRFSDHATNPANPFYVHPNDDPSLVLVTPLLDGTNYYSWSHAIKAALISKNKWKFVDGTFTQPDPAHILYYPWVRCNNMVLSWLKRSISKNIAKSIIWIENAYIVWKNLEYRFSQGDLFKISDTKDDSTKLQKDGDECSRRDICSICLNEISTAERVGLLPCCDHPFCYLCICGWRSSGHATWKKRKACPICSKLAFYVVPSKNWVTGEERKKCIEEYIGRCRLIHCKYFAHGDGLCPHKHRCFYRHEMFPHSYRWRYGISPPPPPPPPPPAAQSPDTEIERILNADDYDFSDDSQPDSTS